MSGSFRIFLKGGERVYINGAVLRVDRKVTLELLNNATFLLEQHVMNPEETRSPLRQLYFTVQTMLIDPASVALARTVFQNLSEALLRDCTTEDLVRGVAAVRTSVEAGRLVDALKGLRSLFPIEDAVLSVPAQGTIRERA
jgi:flagellar protein FlbT